MQRFVVLQNIHILIDDTLQNVHQQIDRITFFKILKDDNLYNKFCFKKVNTFKRILQMLLSHSLANNKVCLPSSIAPKILTINKFIN